MRFGRLSIVPWRLAATAQMRRRHSLKALARPIASNIRTLLASDTLSILEFEPMPELILPGTGLKTTGTGARTEESRYLMT